MHQQLDLQSLSVQDVLCNPFGGPHWLPVEYGFTPLPEIKRPPNTLSLPLENPPTSPPPYEETSSDLKTYTAKELTLSQEELGSLREDGHLSCDRKRFDPGKATNLHGDDFKKYVEQKMQRFGRQPHQNHSMPHRTLADRVSTKVQKVIGLVGLGQANDSQRHSLADAPLQENNGTQTSFQDAIPGETTCLPVRREMEPHLFDERADKSHLSPSGSSSSHTGRQQWPSADFEQDVKTFVDASRPDRKFWQNIETPLRSSYKVPRRREDNSMALGNLFYSQMDRNACLKSDQREKRRLKVQNLSDVMRRPARPAYITPPQRSVKLRDGENESYANDSTQQSDEEPGKDSVVDPPHAVPPDLEWDMDFNNPYTGAWLTRRECHLIWAILRKVLTAPHHGFRRIWTTYNRALLDMIFTEIIQQQRETWWVRAKGGNHIPPTAKLDCRRIVEALNETPNPKFCLLKVDVDNDPVGGYWDVNAGYALGQWIEAREPWSVKFEPLELIAPSKSEPTQSVERTVLGPFLNENGRYWDRVEPRRTTFLDPLDKTPILNSHRKRKYLEAARVEGGVWAQSLPSVDLDCDESAFNRDEVRNCLKKGFRGGARIQRRRVRYKPANQSDPNTPSRASVQAGMMANGQDFFLELRKQITALQVGEQTGDDESNRSGLGDRERDDSFNKYDV